MFHIARFQELDTTTWAWKPGTGKLASKTDAAGKAVTYTYDAAGQLHTRIWARKEGGTTDLVTTYAYDAAGRLTGTDYSDDTPDVAITLDRTGRAAQITDASGTRTSTYDGPGGVLSAIGYSGADSPLAGLAVNYGFDDNKRRSSVSVMQGAATLSTTGYTYEPTTGRMATVSHGGQSAAYDWTTEVAGLPGTVSYSGIGITGIRTPDAHGRLDDITWTLPPVAGANGPGTVMLKNDYTLDDRGRRTAATRENSAYNWTYGYNDRSEVTSGARTGEQFAYQYDEIGNRTQATASLAQTTSYTANALNQYSAITNPDPGRRKVKGTASPYVRVTVKQTLEGQQPPAAPVTLGQFGWSSSGAATGFSTSVSAPTASGPAWLKVSVEGSRIYMGYNGPTPIWARPDHLPVVYKKESGFYFPPKDESLTYDADGNLILDGRWTWAWDGENRLKSMETTAAAAAAGVPRQRLEFVYDSQSRRVRKVVKSFSSTSQSFVVTSDTRFLYDGWNVIAELEASPSLPVSSSPRLAATYAWGLDLSGTETGAGGVGGLLLEALYSATSTTGNNSQPLPTSVLAPLYDGNGNVLAYAVCSTGQIVARYEGDPFGKLLIKDEDTSVAGRLHHQFSTKYADDETGLLDYINRIYQPSQGRWLSRDRVGERGGINLYGMCGNDAVNHSDYLGFRTTDVTWGPLTCPKGSMARFIQVVYNGPGRTWLWGLIEEDVSSFVDDGTHGPDPVPREWPFYPGAVGDFEDHCTTSSSTTYEVCMTCVSKTTGQIGSIGPCKRYTSDGKNTI